MYYRLWRLLEQDKKAEIKYDDHIRDSMCGNESPATKGFIEFL